MSLRPRVASVGTRLALAPLAFLAVVLPGCMHRTVVTAIPHPMTTGRLDDTTIQHDYVGPEDYRGLPPGSLADEATIARMDAEAVCFDVRLRAIDDGAGQSWTALENWRIGMRADDTEIVGATVRTEPHVAEVHSGLNPVEVQTGEETVCTNRDDQGRCRRWERRPITETQMVPGPVVVVTGGGSICFPNGGRVTAQTSRVRLELGFRARSRSFEWQLVR